MGLFVRLRHADNKDALLYRITTPEVFAGLYCAGYAVRTISPVLCMLSQLCANESVDTGT